MTAVIQPEEVRVGFKFLLVYCIRLELLLLDYSILGVMLDAGDLAMDAP
jgi:hypothetical protein